MATFHAGQVLFLDEPQLIRVLQVSAVEKGPLELKLTHVRKRKLFLKISCAHLA